MDKESRLLDSKVTDAVIKPDYLFLSDSILNGTVLKFVGQEIKGEKETVVFNYADSDGKMYSFSHYDILSFTINGEKVSNRLKSIQGSRAYIADEFVIKSSEIRTDKTTQQPMRPYFAYKGFDTYKQNKATGNFSKDQLKQALIMSGVKPDYDKLFYRSIDIDRDIIVIEETE